MSSNLSIKVLSHESFDYSNLDPETLSFVQLQTGEIRSLMKRTAQDIIEIGQRLIKVKKCLGHGQYRKWIEAEFNWGKSTANSFENVAKQFSDVQNLDTFAPSALYELAAPSTPEAARKEAIILAKAGKKISYTVSKQIKQKHQNKLAKLKSESTEQPLSSGKSQLVITDRKESTKDSHVLPTNVVDSHILSQRLNQQKVLEVYSPLSEKPTRTTTQKTVNLSLSTDSKSLQYEKWWRLGNHKLYYGEPNSQQFQNQLPQKIALAVAFPPNHNWHWGKIERKINSSLTLSSSYKDIDLRLLRELLRNALELYTESKEIVFMAFVPDPAFLLLAESLDCQCFLAESDLERCEAVIQAWKQTGGDVETMALAK
ncbi:DUF3102 domain-containing protein [Pleurocapsa sp. PCC 7319]|uniref:DUF3102 domain-containing protein n=1 Tax=Pleurocapsa sp. PCC 7319 TaxID=118161 RepID=UPI00036B203C|nr:DUF3102 domain-containing protein [Pleurocapsa sp. PCC 7319]